MIILYSAFIKTHKLQSCSEYQYKNLVMQSKAEQLVEKGQSTWKKFNSRTTLVSLCQLNSTCWNLIPQ